MNGGGEGMHQLNAAVVGTGFIGRVHARAIRASRATLVGAGHGA
jgi:hypothetical protein